MARWAKTGHAATGLNPTGPRVEVLLERITALEPGRADAHHFGRAQGLPMSDQAAWSRAAVGPQARLGLYW
jgi:hypothetical protein